MVGGSLCGATDLPTTSCYVHKVYEAAKDTPEEELEYDMVITNDFNSLYPSIIESLNLSPETLLLYDVHETSSSPDGIPRPLVRNIEMHEIHEPLIKHVYRVIQAHTDDSLLRRNHASNGSILAQSAKRCKEENEIVRERFGRVRRS